VAVNKHGVKIHPGQTAYC